MSQIRSNALLVMLMTTIILLMIAIAGLFLRMNQLQNQVLAAVHIGASDVTPQELGLPKGSVAPNFTLPDLAGRPLSLTDFTWKRVLLAFFSTSCSACQQTYPHLKAFREAHPELQVVMISRGSTDDNRQMVAKQGFSFPVLTWQDDMVKSYQVPATPFFYMVDQTGVVVAADVLNTQNELTRLAGIK